MTHFLSLLSLYISSEENAIKISRIKNILLCISEFHAERLFSFNIGQYKPYKKNPSLNEKTTYLAKK